MNEQKLKGLIGLALRARQAAAGMDAGRMMIRSGKCGVLLLDGETGPNTRKKAEALCAQYRTPMRILPKGMIGSASGRDNMVLALKYGSFAEQILAETDYIQN